MITPGELRDAADTIEHLSGYMDYPNPDRANWSAYDLRHEADVMEEEL